MTTQQEFIISGNTVNPKAVLNKLGKKRLSEQKFCCYDADGKKVGKEYDSKEEAESACPKGGSVKQVGDDKEESFMSNIRLEIQEVADVIRKSKRLTEDPTGALDVDATGTATASSRNLVSTGNTITQQADTGSNQVVSGDSTTPGSATASKTSVGVSQQVNQDPAEIGSVHPQAAGMASTSGVPVPHDLSPGAVETPPVGDAVRATDRNAGVPTPGGTSNVHPSDSNVGPLGTEGGAHAGAAAESKAERSTPGIFQGNTVVVRKKGTKEKVAAGIVKKLTGRDITIGNTQGAFNSFNMDQYDILKLNS